MSANHSTSTETQPAFMVSTDRTVMSTLPDFSWTTSPGLIWSLIKQLPVGRANRAWYDHSMSETTMIERLARKLCEQDGGDPDAIRIGEGKAAGRTWRGWEAHASQARALLAVIREPTEAMIRKAEAEYDAIFPEDQPLADSIWQFMIDEALKD